MRHGRVTQAVVGAGLAPLILAACGARQAELPSLPTATRPITAAPATPTSVPTEYPYTELVSLFDYDPQTPLDIRERSVSSEGGVGVHDLSFAGAGGSPVTAYLIVPDGEGPFAAVIYAHWGQGDRNEFLAEATETCQLGAVCLLLDAPTRRPGYTELVPDALIIQTVVEIRRAVDLLAARPDVDLERLGYVGHSLGALTGGIAAGVEPRIDAFVLMTGTPRISDAGAAPANTDPRLDPIHYVRHAYPAALYYQFAERDEYITREAALAFYEAGSQPKTIQWYDATHALNEQARLDRIQWLTEQLGLARGPLDPSVSRRMPAALTRLG